MKPPKGSVAIENRDNRIRLRWSFNGERYCLSLGLNYTQINLKAAQQVANQIELDILSGNFDLSLNKYKPAKISFANKSKLSKNPNLLEVWDVWVNSLKLTSRTKNRHYMQIRGLIRKANPKLKDPKWFTKIDTLSPEIWNSRLSYLSSCLDWCIDKGYAAENPYKGLKRRKSATKAAKPFTKQEINSIILAFRTDQFCPQSSSYKHSYYADYVEFLFLTGCRPAEAIGLQRKHIDLERNEIVICSVLARGDNGETSSNKRVRKETKTGNIRYLTMTERLRQIMESRCADLQPDCLVFRSPKGLAINDNNFTRRQWKPVLEGLGIEYRKPYTTRHTMASIAIEQGIPLTGVAYLLGHKDTTMVMRTYGHMINRPSLPEIDI
ncbi:integrase family protein [Thalassoporum mexicanum PCC 7367]|uniref:site-specific integrase n=1 Tax=Thalassoporum mexicanum TaxID=3457544 RepID=UPI00029FD8FF|nr:site-specific integrase [Pseudanabaena sp. PCC 7367]AFY69167.1 integrase family protein [Pseudanabaena sp. PCC 7367]